MTGDDGLLWACLLDGTGGGREVTWPEVRAADPQDGILWLHFDRQGAESRSWLAAESGLAPLIVDALLAEETRPRSFSTTDGLLAILRGVNLNPGADPGDMVALRIYVEERRVISVRARKLMAAQDLRESVAAGRGPTGPADFLVRMADRLVDRMGPVVDDIGDVVDGLENELLESENREIRHKLRSLRQQAIGLRRHLAPQRDALMRMHMEELHWFEAVHKAHLREVSDRVTRYVEDLDEARERAAVVQDELMNRLSERMNKTIYLLTVVAAVLMPLSFITGLLGVNVGGIPGSDSPWAFAILCGALVTFVVVQVVVFRRLKWI